MFNCINFLICFRNQPDLENQPLIINNHADLKKLYKRVDKFNILINSEEEQTAIQQSVDQLRAFTIKNKNSTDLIKQIQDLWGVKTNKNTYFWIDPNNL